MINLTACTCEELALGFIQKRQFNIPRSPTDQGEMFYITAITSLRNNGWMLTRVDAYGKALQHIRWEYGPTPGHPTSSIHNLLRYIV